nr:hypothetical protein [Halomonas socia]
MIFEPSPFGPRETDSDDVFPDFCSLWDQLRELSDLLRHLNQEIEVMSTDRLRGILEDIEKGGVDPEEDWKIELESLSSSRALYKKRTEHFLAAERQVVYFQVLFNKNHTIEASVLKSAEKKEFYFRLHAKLANCLVWGCWHYYVSLSTHASLKKNANNKAENAARVQAAWREDSEALLRTLVRGRLKKRPHYGWPSRDKTAVRIATSLEPFLNELEIDISERGNDLIHRIDLMIGDDLTLKRIHMENS